MRVVAVRDMSELTPQQLRQVAQLDHDAFAKAPFEEHRICVSRECARLVGSDTPEADADDCPRCGDELEELLPMSVLPQYLGWYFSGSEVGPCRGAIVVDDNGDVQGYNMAARTKLKDLLYGFGYRGTTDIPGLFDALKKRRGLRPDDHVMHWNRTVLSLEAQAHGGLFREVCKATFDQFGDQDAELGVIGETKKGGQMLPLLLTFGYEPTAAPDEAGWWCLDHERFGELSRRVTLQPQDFRAQFGSTLKTHRRALAGVTPVTGIRYPNMPKRMHELFTV